jgi:hypothetical protein
MTAEGHFKNGLAVFNVNDITLYTRPPCGLCETTSEGGGGCTCQTLTVGEGGQMGGVDHEDVRQIQAGVEGGQAAVQGVLYVIDEVGT